MMMRQGSIFLLLVVLSLGVRAENGCPPGYLPWKIPVENTSDCVAIANYGQEPDAPMVSESPAPRWVSRWGAIAIGSTAGGGGVGVATDQHSRRKAESIAMKQCRDTGGGKECEVFSYHDQCAVVAWGNRSYVVRSAASIDIATGVALEQCRERTEGCRIFYSACSLPQPSR